MNFSLVAPVQMSEWGWLFAFGLVSLALVALAVLADALYEGYHARLHHARGPGLTTDSDARRDATRRDELAGPKKAA